mmetsp:Transcript_35594/g.80318  ORF Transcript_35594/g.80318 Transcript_35594/m.80318 type:complete len:246 (+) Transcript_35594:826-1563(+)
MANASCRTSSKLFTMMVWMEYPRLFPNGELRRILSFLFSHVSSWNLPDPVIDRLQPPPDTPTCESLERVCASCCERCLFSQSLFSEQRDGSSWPDACASSLAALATSALLALPSSPSSSCFSVLPAVEAPASCQPPKLSCLGDSTSSSNLAVGDSMRGLRRGDKLEGEARGRGTRLAPRQAPEEMVLISSMKPSRTTAALNPTSLVYLLRRCTASRSGAEHFLRVLTVSTMIMYGHLVAVVKTFA